LRPVQRIENGADDFVLHVVVEEAVRKILEDAVVVEGVISCGEKLPPETEEMMSTSSSRVRGRPS